MVLFELLPEKSAAAAGLRGRYVLVPRGVGAVPRRPDPVGPDQPLLPPCEGTQEQRASCAQKREQSKSEAEAWSKAKSRSRRESPEQEEVSRKPRNRDLERGSCSAPAWARTTRAALDLPGTHRL